MAPTPKKKLIPKVRPSSTVRRDAPFPPMPPATTTVPLASLRQDPENRRLHDEQNLEMIVDAIGAVGLGRSVVIDEDDVLLAGNGVARAALQAGVTKVRVIETDGTELIAVKRTNLSPDQKRALAIFDNRTAELGVWNLEQLRKDAAAGLPLDAFWSPDEAAALLAQVHVDGVGRTDPDAAPDIRPTDIKVGDLFELGDHRLLCGDSTNPDSITRLLAGVVPPLMVTDPPYGVNYDPAWRARADVNLNRKKLGTVTNDDRADWTEVWKLFPGDVAYVWHAGLLSDVVKGSLERAGFGCRAQIIWAKDRLVLGRGDYHWQHEPLWYAVRDGAKGHRTTDRRPTTLWRIRDQMVLGDSDNTTVWEISNREDGGHGHGTQKPIECMARPMRNHLALQVFDPFVGSGSSVIAATTLNRRCFAVDLEPTWCQVTIDRWEAFTGQKAQKVGGR